MTSDEVFQVLVSQAGGTYISLSYTESCTEDDEDMHELKSRSSTCMSKERSDSATIYGISMSSDEKMESHGSLAGMEEVRRALKEGQPDWQQSKTHPDFLAQEKCELRSHSMPIFSTPTASLLKSYDLTVGPVVGHAQKSNPSSSTEIVGDMHSRQDLSEDSSHCNVVALCTLDG